jgi:hypothetical protein
MQDRFLQPLGIRRTICWLQKGRERRANLRSAAGPLNASRRFEITPARRRANARAKISNANHRAWL